MEKMDRSFHWSGKFDENEERLKEYWPQTTPRHRQRLEAAFYLNSVAYNF